MNKRLEMLLDLVASGKADSFGRYALALEYKRERRFEEALQAFESLRKSDPDYLPMYYMAGQLLLDQEQSAAAVEWFGQGIEVARRKGDSKTLRELELALSEAS